MLNDRLTDRHSLHAEDLAFLMGMQQKDLRKLCAKLREDRLIAVYGPQATDMHLAWRRKELS
jgi:transcription initiation factor TFIIE subunit alpha